MAKAEKEKKKPNTQVKKNLKGSTIYSQHRDNQPNRINSNKVKTFTLLLLEERRCTLYKIKLQPLYMYMLFYYYN